MDEHPQSLASMAEGMRATPSQSPAPRSAGHDVYILTIAALLVAGSYAVYAARADRWPFSPSVEPVVSASPSPSASMNSVDEETTYTNAAYGFSVKLPLSWSDYVVQSSPELPRAEKSIRVKYNASVQLPAQTVEFVIFTLAQWGEEQKIEQPHPIELGRSSAYVITTPFRYEFEGLPGEADIPGILASFQLTK